MRFSLAVAALAPVLSVYGANILVQVGAGGQLAFSPSNITAQVGDVVAFQFQGKNHSVTQSTFASPCSIMTAPSQGIDSGFQPVATGATNLPQWSLTVNNASAPLWFFCAQTNPAVHCHAGMVFSVNANPDTNKSFAVYQAAAMASNGAASGAAGAASGGAASGAAGAASGVASAAGAAASNVGSAIPGATSVAGSVAGSIAGAAATAAAGALTGAAGALTGAAGALTGSPSPSATGNSTSSPSSAGRVTTSAVTMLAVVGLTALLL